MLCSFVVLHAIMEIKATKLMLVLWRAPRNSPVQCTIPTLQVSDFRKLKIYPKKSHSPLITQEDPNNIANYFYKTLTFTLKQPPLVLWGNPLL